jgi:hypothetical protein
MRRAFVALGLEPFDVPLDAAALERCRGAMRGSIADMKARLDDPATNAAAMAGFPMPEGRERCGRCPFRRPCGRM